MMAVRTPYLLIDVDGVLAPVVAGPGPPGFVPRTVRTPDGREHGVLLNPDHGLWLDSLRSRFRLVWATGWEHEAARLLAPLLGLPVMPVIEFTDRPMIGMLLNKLPDVIAFVGDTPAAWVDDDLDDEAGRWASSRRAPTLLVKTDPTVGLTRAHVHQLADFGDLLASGGWT